MIINLEQVDHLFNHSSNFAGCIAAILNLNYGVGVDAILDTAPTPEEIQNLLSSDEWETFYLEIVSWAKDAIESLRGQRRDMIQQN